jgi:hypothetical protein
MRLAGAVLVVDNLQATTAALACAAVISSQAFEEIILSKCSVGGLFAFVSTQFMS